jgi:hypothetical protein
MGAKSGLIQQTGIRKGATGVFSKYGYLQMIGGF